MKDMQLEDHYSKQLGAVCHFEIVDNDLIITVDYESGGFASWLYLELIGKDKFEIIKILEKAGKRMDEYVEEVYQVHHNA